MPYFPLKKTFFANKNPAERRLRPTWKQTSSERREDRGRREKATAADTTTTEGPRQLFGAIFSLRLLVLCFFRIFATK